MEIYNETLTGETITVASQEDLTIARDSVLEDCLIVSRATAKYLTLGNFTMNGGMFFTKVKLVNYRWNFSKLYGVTFKGKFDGNDFGRLGGGYDNLGDIRDCNFVHASVHLCRFFQCDLSTMTFGPNHVITPHTRRSQEELRTLSWPGDVRIIADIFAADYEELSFHVFDVALLAKEEKLTEDQVREAFGRLNDAILT